MACVEREYEYRPSWRTIVLCGGFFGLCAVVLGWEAASNDRGVIINGIIELSRDGATIFYWTLCAAAIAFVLVAALLAYHRLAFRQRLRLGPAGLTLPASRWSRAEKEIAYRDIRGLSAAQVSGQRFLYVSHAGGRHIITASMLPSAAAFDEVCALLADNLRAAPAAGGSAQLPAAPERSP